MSCSASTPPSTLKDETAERGSRTDLGRDRLSEKNTPSGSDLERARTRIIARHVFSRDDLQSLALYLGELDIAGLSPEDDEKRMQILAKITPEDIQLAAQTFLTHDRLTLSYVLPKEARHE